MKTKKLELQQLYNVKTQLRQLSIPVDDINKRLDNLIAEIKKEIAEEEGF